MIGTIREWWRRVRSVLQRRALDQDLGGELAAHLEMAIEDNLARGLAPAEARRQAMVAFGSFDLAKEAHRDARGLPLIESVGQDIRYAVRTLRRAPGFSVVAVLILALGIGANTAIFSLVSAVLLRPLPFADAERVVTVWEDLQGRGGPPRVQCTPADYAAWSREQQSMAGVAALVTNNYSLTGSGDPELLDGVRATGAFFSVIGLPALIGRTFDERDDRPDAPIVTVLSERLWKQQFGSDPEVIGRAITLNGLPHTVVGIVRSDFPYPEKDVQLWVPARLTPEELAAASSYYLYVLGRLKPNLTVSQAAADFTGIAQRQAAGASGDTKVRVSVTGSTTI